MQHNNLLDKIFPQYNQISPEHRQSKKINSLVDCFHNFTNRSPDRPVKGMLPIRMPNKQLLPSQAPKRIPNPSQLIEERDNLQPIFRVESLRAEYQPKSITTNGNRYFHTISLEKSHLTRDLITPHSQKKIKGYTTIDNNIEALPIKFIQRSLQKKNDRQKAQSAFQTAKNTRKSKNLLQKMALIQQNTSLVESTELKKIPNKTIFSPKKHKPRVINLKKNMQQLAEQQRKLKLQFKKQISEEYAKPFNPPSNITAASYIIYEPNFSRVKRKKVCLPAIDNISSSQHSVSPSKNPKFPHSHKVIASYNSRNSVEVASLTKIMTCIVALQLCQKFKLNASEEKICISKFQSNIIGTSAQISEGQIYTLQDLYYGLMLPSGNDASIAIAVWGGKILMHKQGKVTSHKKKDYYSKFIQQMNITARKLGMVKTTYANSHGLVNPDNRSCAYDIAILSEHAMNNHNFRKIVSCRIYKTIITYDPTQSNSQNAQIVKKEVEEGINNKEMDDEIEEGVDKDLDSNEEQQPQNKKEDMPTKQVQWENTHKLLQQKPQEYIGIKTGITNMAGPCLASCVKQDNGRYFIIVVLNCDRLSMRFKDTQNLKKWLYQKQGIVSSPRKKCPKSIKRQIDEEDQT